MGAQRTQPSRTRYRPRSSPGGHPGAGSRGEFAGCERGEGISRGVTLSRRSAPLPYRSTTWATWAWWPACGTGSGWWRPWTASWALGPGKRSPPGWPSRPPSPRCSPNGEAGTPWASSPPPSTSSATPSRASPPSTSWGRASPPTSSTTTPWAGCRTPSTPPGSPRRSWRWPGRPAGPSAVGDEPGLRRHRGGSPALRPRGRNWR